MGSAGTTQQWQWQWVAPGGTPALDAVLRCKTGLDSLSHARGALRYYGDSPGAVGVHAAGRAESPKANIFDIPVFFILEKGCRKAKQKGKVLKGLPFERGRILVLRLPCFRAKAEVLCAPSSGSLRSNHVRRGRWLS